jgi:hypothetical protein
MTIFLSLPSTGRLCFGIFVGCHRGTYLSAPLKSFCFNGREALAKVRGSRGDFTAERVQLLEHAPEDHPPVIPAAGAPDEGESALQALKLLVERPHGWLRCHLSAAVLSHEERACP